MYKFEPILKSMLWGGEKLIPYKEVDSKMHSVGESWEISAHNSSPSIIADGCEKGRSLAEVEPKFPVLAKVIDAKTRLSVQVHPADEYALTTVMISLISYGGTPAPIAP